jgi:gliding motility-associated-like protein
MRYLTQTYLARLIAFAFFLAIGQLAYTQCTITVSSKTDVLCAGASTGSITVTGGGGAAPYTYRIGTGAFQTSNVFSNLAAGAYVVSAKDVNDCIADVTVTIAEPAPLSGSALIVPDVLCSTGTGLGLGTATITASGGTAPYQFKLDNGAYQPLGIFLTLQGGSYVVTIRDANNCTAEVPITVTQLLSNVSGSISSQTNIPCTGGTGSVTITGSGGASPYTYKIGTGAYSTNNTFSNLAAGDYTVTVRDNNGCVGDVPVTITQTASTVTGIISSQTNVSCAGGNTGSVTVTGGGGTAPYEYKIGTGAYQGSGTFSGLAPGAYTVTVRDDAGCTKDVPVTITQDPSPVTAVISSQTNVPCSGGNLGSVTITGGGGLAPYEYKLGAGAFQSVNTFSNLAVGDHVITVRDANQCTKDITVTITQLPSPVTATLGTKTDVSCSGTAGSATIVGGGGAGPYEYKLGAGAYQASGTFTGLTVGNHVITVRDANQCTKDITVTIVQETGNVTATISSQTNIPCMGGTGSVTITGGGGTAPYLFSLNGAAFQPTGVFNNLALGTYTITVRDANSCTKDVTVTITQPVNNVTATISSQTNIPCMGGTGSVTVAGGGGTAPYQYSLNAGVFQNSGTFSGLTAGTHTVTARDANGCSRDVTVTIIQPANTVTATVSSKTDIPCMGGTGSATITGGGGTAPYTYKLGAGSFQTSGVFTGLAAGTYTVTVKDNIGCEKDVSFSIAQLPNTVTAAIGSKTDVNCAGGNTGSITAVGGGGTAPYEYRLGAGVFQTSATFNNLATGTYTITVRDAAGCMKDVTTSIVQMPNTVVATLSSKTDIPCTGGTGSATVAGSGGTGPYTYRLGSGAFQASGTFTGLAAGTYTITARDVNLCTNDVSVTILQLPNTVTATISSKTDIPCSGGTGSVTVQGGGGTAPYTYKLGAGAYQAGATFSNLAAGTYTITVRDAVGCTKDVSVTIAQLANTVTAAIGSKTDIPCTGGTGSVTVTAGGGSAPYTYRIGSGAFQSSSTFTGLAAGSYTITVRDNEGCTRDVTVSIVQEPNTVVATVSSKTDIPCTGGTGAVSVQGSGSTGPYTYRLDAGAFQSNGNFTGLAAGSHTVTVRDGGGCTDDVSFTIAQIPNTVTATVSSKTDIPCTGGTGSVTVAGGGGTAPYNYRLGAGAFQLSGTFTGLAAGTHTVTVRDNAGCTKDVTVTIVQQPNTVTATISSKTDIPCSGGTGSATVAGGGGTAPYTYKIGSGAYQASPTFTGLAAGTYTITVQDFAGCTKDVNVTILQVANTVIATVNSKTDIPCTGGTGSVTIGASGGTTPYNYKIGAGAYQTGASFTGLAAGNYTATVRDASGCTKDVVFTIVQAPNTVTAAIGSKTDVACSGGNTGSVTAVGGGGTAPYTYRLGTGAFQTSATFNNLAAGDYTITVRDAVGCTEDVAVSIIQLANTVSASISSKTDIPCTGGTGSVTVAASGGTAPYTYKIGSGAYQPSPVFNNLAAGSYTATVRDANGCTKDIAVTITQLPNTVTATVVSKTDIPCSGGSVGSVTVSGGGGTAPYTYRSGAGAYQPSPTFNNLSAGDHIITVRDANGCTATVTVNIAQQPNTVVATFLSKTDVTCTGGNTGSVTVAGSGGTAPYEYRIGTGAYQATGSFTGLGTGNYTITVRDAAGCTNSVAVNITQAPNTVTAAISSKTNISCSGGNTGEVTIAAGGGTAPYQYRLASGAFQPSPTFTGLPAGDHIFTVRDANGCTKDVTANIAQTVNTVTAAIASKTDIPCMGGTGSVTVTGGGGTAPYTYKIGTGAYQTGASFSNLSAGQYVITVRDAGGCTKDISLTIVQIPNTVTATVTSKTDIPCSGTIGSVTIAGGGGTAPYEYRIGTGPYQTSGFFVVLGVGTYTATVRDASGCTKDVSFTIAQANSTVTASVVSKTDVPCSGGSIGSVTVAGGGGTAPYTYRLGTGAFQPGSTFNNLPAGDHTITVQDAFGCTREITVTIAQLNNTVTASIASKTDIACFGGGNGAVSISAGGGTAPYTYKLDNGVFQASANFSNLAAGDHIITVKDAGGCMRDVPVTITQPAAVLAASISSKADIPCSGGTGSVTIAGTGGTAPYEFKLGTGAYQASGAFSGLAAGTYIATVRDAAGCTKDVSVNIAQLINTVTATVSSKTDIPCSGGTGSVTVAGGGGTTPYEYKLGAGAYQATGTFTGLAAGNYIVTVKDASGCTRDLAVIITQATNTVTATVTSKTDVPCSGGNTGSVTVAGGGGTAPYTYKLDNGAYQAGATFNTLAAGDYTVTVRDAVGCTRDVAVNIAQATNTVAAALTSKTDVPCSGGNTGSITVAGSGGITPYSYKIGTGAYQPSGTFNGLAAGSYTVTVRDAAGCTNDLAIVIGQAANSVTAAVTAQTDVPCSGGNTGSVTVIGGGGTAPYTYKIGNGNYQVSPVFNNLSAGDFIVTVKDAVGCTRDLNITITQTNNTVTAAVGTKTDVPCSGGNTGSVTVTAGGGTAPYTYKLGNGSYQPDATFNNLAAGNYTITVKDAVGCTRDVAVTIAQLNNTVTAAVSAKTDVPCAGGNIGSVTITGGGGTGPYTYKLGNGSYQASGVFNDLAAGDYTVTVKDAAGCMKDINFTIAQQNNTVTATVSSKTDIPCSGGNAGAVTVTGGGGTAPYTYKLGNGAYQPSGTFNNLAAGEYIITVKDAAGCTKDVTVRIAPAGGANAGTISPASADPQCEGTTQVLKASDGVSFQWYRNDTLISGATSKEYSATQSGKYSVEISNGTCSVKASNTVTLVFRPCVDAEIFVPKAFTPNGNNKNDKLLPRFNNISEIRSFRIYNRWGQLMYQTSTIGDGWDGTFKGVRQPMETYSWTLECVDANGNTVKRSGKTILIR